MQIWSPEPLRQYFKSLEINYSLANFGTVPYGLSIMGTLFEGFPINGCTELQNTTHRSGNIFVFTRGDCHFAIKVLNAQKAGATLVIIIDNQQEDAEKVFPVEKGIRLLGQVSIPGILLNQREGERILYAMKQNKVEISVDFPFVDKSETLTSKILLQVDDYASYDLVTRLDTLIDLFGTSVDFQFHYKIYKNTPLDGFGNLDPSNPDKSFNEIHIDKDYYFVLKNDTFEKDEFLFMESVLQMCIFKIAPDMYFEYMNRVKQLCFVFLLDDGSVKAVTHFSGCTDNVYESFRTSTDFNLDDRLTQCTDLARDEAKNLLKANQEPNKYYLLNYTPLIHVNNRLYLGNFEDILHFGQTLCSVLQSHPEACKGNDIISEYHDATDHGLIWFLLTLLFFIVLVSSILIGIFYLAYRWKLNQEMNQNIEKKVNEAILKHYGKAQVDKVHCIDKNNI